MITTNQTMNHTSICRIEFNIYIHYSSGYVTKLIRELYRTVLPYGITAWYIRLVVRLVYR